MVFNYERTKDAGNEDGPVLKRLSQKTRSGISYLARPGSGPTFVFLHGIGSNATSFLPVLDHLPEHLNILIWNAPGYLSSAPVDDPWPTPATYAKALRQFLDDLQIASAHLVGHSLGTLIAASFARQFPGYVQSLVLASAAQGYGVPKGAALPDKVRTRIDDLKRLGPVAFAMERAANLIHDPAANANLVSAVRTAMAEINPEGYTQAVHLLASGDLAHDVAQLAICPGFIIGAQDRITPIEQTTRAARAWETANKRKPPIHTIQNAGHAVYLQKPRAFCAALMALTSENAQDATGNPFQNEDT